MGGIKEKILAAKRAGLKQIILSEENRKDVAEIPERYLEGVDIHYVNNMLEVVDYSLMMNENVATVNA